MSIEAGGGAYGTPGSVEVDGIGERDRGADLSPTRPSSIARRIPGSRNGGEARSFLNRIVEGTYDDHPAVGLGRDVGVVGPGLVAGALVARGTVVHLTAFAEPAGRRSDPAPEGSSGRRYASYRQRLESLRSRYER